MARPIIEKGGFMKPFILINFKAYEEGSGKKAVEVAKAAESAAGKGADVAVAVQAADIMRVSESVKIPVFAQHIDPVGYGSHTGATLAATVKDAGAFGTIVNHSEKRLEISDIEKCINLAKDAGLSVVACAPDSKVAEAISVFGPDFIAVEPPELISGNISVSEAKPALIEESVKLVKRINPSIPVLVGAGIKTQADARKAVELGASGILVASGVMKAKDPQEEIILLIEGLLGI